ncbi:MAG: type VI secretion system baseplate subunit TssE [Pseudomonadota bacterium]|nr:type VI secretion system baseplate subunit TssE [Pseudomonadota bacterium]
MAQEKGFAPGIWDRLMGASEPHTQHRTVQPLTLEQLKASVARDLEALLNTRVAIPEEHLSMYPRCRASILNYGVRDFAGMCLTSSDDRKIICDFLKLAIQCYEPRLGNVRARVVVEPGVMNRLDFIIFGTLNFPGAAGRVEFNATLQPSTLHYSITPSGRRAMLAREAA